MLLEPKWQRQWLYESDGEPTPRGVVGFVFLMVIVFAVRRCPKRDAQHAQSSVPSSAVRWSVERDVQHADIPVLFSALRRFTERDVQHADSSVAPGLRATSVARSGTCSGAQPLTRTLFVDQREMFILRTPQWRLLLRAPSLSGLPFRRHSYIRCLCLLFRRFLNRFRRQWQAVYPMFQNRARLTLRMYLSMNSRYVYFCCASSLQGNRSAHVSIASRT